MEVNSKGKYKQNDVKVAYVILKERVPAFYNKLPAENYRPKTG